MGAEARTTTTIVVSVLVVALGSFSATVAIRSSYYAWIANTCIADLASLDSDVRRQAVETLRNRNIDTEPYLLALLNNRNTDVRVFAAWELNQQLPIPPAVVEALIKVATDEGEDERVRWPAIFALQKVGQQAHNPLTETEHAVIEALCVAVESSNANTSCNAAHAIREFGPRAAVATEPLNRATKSHSLIVRASAAGALIAVDPGAYESMLPVLVAVAQSEDSSARTWAFHFIGLLGSKANSAVPALKKIAVANPDWSVQVNETLELIEINNH